MEITEGNSSENNKNNYSEKELSKNSNSYPTNNSSAQEVYISAKRDFKEYGYTADYLGFLCRTNKVKCKKINGEWLIEERSLLDFIFRSKDYFSIKDAAKKYSYTSDYLGQLCRGRKIKAKRIKNTWLIEEKSLLKFKKENELLKQKLDKEKSKLFKKPEASPLVELNLPKEKSKLFSYSDIGTVLVVMVLSLIILIPFLGNKNILNNNSNLSAGIFYCNISNLLGIENDCNQYFEEEEFKSNLLEEIKVTQNREELETNDQVLSKEAEKAVTEQFGNSVGTIVVEGPINYYENIRERIETRVESGITKNDLETALANIGRDLSNEIHSKLGNIASGNQTIIQNVYNQIAGTQKIDQITDVDLNNPTITGGTISGLAITGSSFAGTSGIFTGNVSANTFTGTGTGTSTLTGGLSVLALNQTGSATSTFTNGIDISGGCISVNGTCLPTEDTGDAFAWTPTTNYGEAVVSTSTPLWIQENIYASSTIYAPTLSITGSTTFNGVEYLFPSSDGTVNQVLTTNAAGGLTWGTASSFSWTPTTNYGETVNATSSPLWIQENIYASSTIYAPNFIATDSTATSTFAGGLTIETSGFVYDLSTNKVGIGTSSPTNQLSVSNQLYVGNNGGTATSTFEGNLHVLDTLQIGSGSSYITSSNVNVGSGGGYSIGGTSVLNATTLGSGVTGSSLTSVGTIGSGVWQGTAITDAYIADTLTIGSGSSVDKGALANSGTLGFDWADSEIGDDLTISSSVAVNAPSYNVGGVLRLGESGDYTTLYRENGTIGMYLGNTDAGNYYDNTTHYFRGAGGSGTFLTLNSGTAAFGGVITGGTYNGQTISSSANFTGTVAAAGVVAANAGISVDGNTVIDDGAGWHRTYGATGWYNATYGGGWYMADTTWIQSYGGKYVYAPYYYSSAYGTYLPAGTGSANYLTKWTGTYTVGNSNIIDNGSNVGIAVSPDGNAGLHVYRGVADSEVLRLQDTDGTCNHNPEAGSEVVSCASDARLKSDIVPADPTLPFLTGIPIREYTVIASGKRKIGTIAQELLSLGGDYAKMVNEDSNGYYMVTEPYTWQIVKAIQELDSRTSGLLSATTSPVIHITEDGNIGIGTDSPNYKLQVAGDIAATAFVNTSTKDSKKDIEYVTEEEKESILDKIKSIGVAKYRYNRESYQDSLRLGLIAEESPEEILSSDGKGVDIYKLATFTLAGVQELVEKVDDLTQELSYYAGEAVDGVISIQKKIFINLNSGNVGIGTNSPEYDLEVNGEVAATSFIDSSLNSDKTNTEEISKEKKKSILDKILSIGVVEYRNDDSFQKPLLVRDEVPKEILSKNAKGLDISKTITFLIVGLQELAGEVSNTKNQILALGTKVVDGVFVIQDKLFINLDSGNVGIGTTTPEYKLEVEGEVAGESFIKVLGEIKDDVIEAINEERRADLLEKIKDLVIIESTYNYEASTTSKDIRVSLNELPEEILSDNKKGIDVFKFLSLLTAGVQELIAKMDNIEKRLSILETITKDITEGGKDKLSSVVETASSFAGEIKEGVLSIGKVITNTITTASITISDRLTIGSAEKPTGITLYNSDGEAYCVSVGVAGAVVSVQGICDEEQTKQEEDNEEQVESNSEFPTLTLNGNNPAEIEIGASYADLGVVVTDDKDDNLGYTTLVNGVEVSQIQLNTASSTTYTITYRATDSDGNTAEVERVVAVGNVIIIDEPTVIVASTSEEILVKSVEGDNETASAPIEEKIEE